MHFTRFVVLKACQAIAVVFLNTVAVQSHAANYAVGTSGNDGTIMTVMWDHMKNRFLNDYPVLMDEAVKVIAPADAEDQFNVPVTVDARAIPSVKKIVVFADLSPIPHVLTFEPENSEPYVSFRFKMEQATPVRAAVLSDDNIWRVGTTLIDAAGGGCTAPAMAHSQENWVDTLGQTRAKIWPKQFGASRLRMTIRHPMDTGLAPGIPAFHIEKVSLTTEDGLPLGKLEISEPVAENPAFTILPMLANGETKTMAQSVHLKTRDIEGNEFTVVVPAS